MTCPFSGINVVECPFHAIRNDCEADCPVIAVYRALNRIADEIKQHP